MPILVKSRRASRADLEARHPGAVIVDVTSRAPAPWVRFSPFYPHGGIPVPLSPGYVSASVEGIWQGLKVFESADVDPSRLAVTDMRGLKRTSRRFGRVLGHRAGFGGDRLLSYLEARRAIYLPAYRWTLDHRLRDLLAELEALGRAGTLVLLDYETNCDVDDPSRPLSHAGLIRLYLERQWPA